MQVFFAKNIHYVGFIIDKTVTNLNPNKSKVIIKLLESSDLKQLQRFLGDINYCSKFMSNIAEISKPLYRLI